MAVSLTEGQMTGLKELMEVSGAFADHLLRIMEHNGLSKVPDSSVTITVTPGFRFTTRHLTFGHVEAETGYISLAKGVYDERYTPTGSFNSAEYEYLFADEELRKRMRKHSDQEKPLPPDGLWVGADWYAPPVDCGVQVDDRLAE